MNNLSLVFSWDGWGRMLLLGAAMTVAVAIAGLCIGAVLGVALTCARVAGGPWLRRCSSAYTTVLRGVPDLLVIYLFYFGGSNALAAVGKLVGYSEFIGMPTFATGALALGMVSAAYQAEVYRGAYQAVPHGEMEAAHAVGMSPTQVFRSVIAPHVLKHALPGLGNVWQLVVKESALISVIGLVELLRAAQLGAGSTRMPFVFYAAALLLYLLITSVSGHFFARAEAHTMRPYRRT